MAVPLVTLLLYALRFPQPLARPGPTALVLVPAVVWTALDFVRVKLDPSGLWGPLFLTQHDLPTAGLAALGGPWLLTLVIVASGWALAALVLRPSLALAPVAGVALLVAALALASVGLRAAPRGDPVMVGVVQPGYDTSEYEEYEPARFFHPRARDRELATLALVADLGELTREAAARGAELVLWPEAVAWVDPRENARVRAAITALVRETGVALTVPAFVEPQSAVVGFTPEAEPTALRPKHRPMWFLGERTIEGEPGSKELGPVSLGTLLGADGQDPASARDLARRGARLIGSATHDWQQLLPQQRAYARLHAVALRLPVAKADWRYGSAIWDGAGRIVADAGLERVRAVLAASVVPYGPMPYERLGDVVGWVAAAATLALLVLAVRLRRGW